MQARKGLASDEEEDEEGEDKKEGGDGEAKPVDENRSAEEVSLWPMLELIGSDGFDVFCC